MCGIIGVASTEGMNNRSERLLFMKMGLDIDSWRGWESTGLALVPRDIKETPIVYKRALNGRDFIQLNTVDKYLSDIEKYPVAIGHNRAATTGRGDIRDHNAHPFQYGHITLVHNGHIRNTYDLKGAVTGAQCPVDSSHVAFSMSVNGEKETLEQVDGGFVFVWWNSETGLLNIARNNERPLHMAFANKENTFYWASELTELLHLLKDVDIDGETGILFPKAGTWYQFYLKNLREYKKIPFVKRQGRQSHNSQNGQRGTGTVTGGAWTDDELAMWETQYGVPYHSPTIIHSPSSSSKQEIDDTEVEEIRQEIANQRLKDTKFSGIPTSPKRIARAKTELKKLGIDYNALKVCVPLSWSKYKNQHNLGSVLARTKKEGLTIEVLGVRNEEYIQYHAAGNLMVDCVNIRKGPKAEIRVIGTVNPKMAEYLASKKLREATALEEITGIGSIERDVAGPGGSKITMARFLELTSNGCSHCSDDIFPKDHTDIVWVGQNGQPLCLDCGTNPEVLNLLTVSETGKSRSAQVH